MACLSSQTSHLESHESALRCRVAELEAALDDLVAEVELLGADLGERAYHLSEAMTLARKLLSPELVSRSYKFAEAKTE